MSQRSQILRIAAGMGATVAGSFGVLQFFVGPQVWWLGVVDLASAAVLLAVPLLYRYGELVAPLTFTTVAYVSTFVSCWATGTDSGLQFFFLTAASITVLILGVEYIALAAILVGVGAALAIALQFLVPGNTGTQEAWLMTVSFVAVIVSACLMVLATLWYALRESRRAEEAMEAEYERSEALLTNILPTSIANRLKDPNVTVVADRYDDASVLFADIVGFTKRASRTTPDQLVGFLNELYTELDRLTDRRGLEKIKTSGDDYMVVSGVPEPRPDHLHELARLALDIADAVAGMRDALGQPVSLRIGLAAGPMVAGVIGSRRFFYDVWGDAVNVAARMESTGLQDRIQVPHDVYERLKGDFVFDERGDVDVKGKGVLHTWYLVRERSPHDEHRAHTLPSITWSS